MPTILLVEDDVAIAEPLSRALNREGYRVRQHTMGGTAMADIKNGDVDLVILDLGLPDMDGLEVARWIRNCDLRIPVLILTARADEVDMVVGLDAGADDYVTKPFRLAELSARVRALLRRSVELASEDEYNVQDIRLVVSSHRAWQAGKELHLTSKEFALLHILIREAGSVVTREAMLKELWPSEDDSVAKTLDMHMSWLRRKLSDENGWQPYITTVRGIGFRFEKPSR